MSCNFLGNSGHIPVMLDTKSFNRRIFFNSDQNWVESFVLNICFKPPTPFHIKYFWCIFYVCVRTLSGSILDQINFVKFRYKKQIWKLRVVKNNVGQQKKVCPLERNFKWFCSQIRASFSKLKEAVPDSEIEVFCVGEKTCW